MGFLFFFFLYTYLLLSGIFGILSYLIYLSIYLLITYVEKTRYQSDYQRNTKLPVTEKSHPQESIRSSDPRAAFESRTRGLRHPWGSDRPS